MNGEEFEYDSDYVDEETEARLYELAYYGEDSRADSTLNAGNIDGSETFIYHSPLTRLSQQELKSKDLLSIFKNGDSNSSSYRSDNSSESDVYKASKWFSVKNIFNDKERLKSTMEALFLMITGRCPYDVEKKAEERMKRLGKKHDSFRYNESYFSGFFSSDSSDEGPPSRKREVDMILGISAPSPQGLAGAKSVPKWFKDLPSDPKYWTLDAEDLRPCKRKRRFRDNDKICERCYGKGHYEWGCTRSGLFCVLCAKEGHLQSSCPLRICPLCLRRGHDLPCPNKYKIYKTICSRCKQKGHESNRCPDIWRQYRFSTKPGPPVKYENYQKQTKTCFNCGERGHLGHECSRSSVYGQPLLSQTVTEFDKHDVYGKATGNSTTHDVWKQNSEIGAKEWEFDEPLYCSFSTGPSNSLPEAGTLLLDESSLNENSQKKKRSGNRGVRRFGANKRRHNQRESQQTLKPFASRKSRRQTFGYSRADQTTQMSAVNGMLMKNHERRSFNEKAVNEPKCRNGCPSLFISNVFSAEKHGRHLHGSDQHQSQGNSSKNFRLRKSKNYRQDEDSFGDTFESRNSSNLRTQASPLRRILKRRERIIRQRAKKRLNSAGNNLPNISNSPFLQFVKKCGWNGGSSNLSPHSERQKGHTTCSSALYKQVKQGRENSKGCPPFSCGFDFCVCPNEKILCASDKDPASMTRKPRKNGDI
ncbi:hypothetical protein Aperf_G00000017759 [Anoplocephala perfoliata]